MGRNCTPAMREPMPYVATMTTPASASPAIQSAIERADTIEQRTHGLPLHAIQSPVDLRDAMINALARLSARADKLARLSG